MKRILFFAVSLLAMVAAPVGAWAQQSRSDYYGPHMMWESGWMFFGPLMMIVFIGLIVVIVVLLVRWLSGQRPSGDASSESKALEILKERFARGEIDKEEYEERRRTLRE